MPRPQMPPAGLIAGSGRLPFLIAAGMRAAGRRVVVGGLAGLASPRIKDQADVFRWVAIVRLGGWFKYFRQQGVREAVMIGGVRKKEIFSPLRLLRYIPDFMTVRMWYSTLRGDKRDNAVLLADLADEGLMTKTPVPRGTEADVEFGWRIARDSADLDIGQSIAVKELDIIAVEAMEGTDAMIRRTGRVCRVGGWTMVKVARPKQDMRFDVPTIGPSTMKNLKDAKCACLVVEAGRTLIVDKPATLALADRLKIAVIGKRPDPEHGRTTDAG